VTVRITDLLGSEVLDAHGRRVGDTHDVRFVQDGPPIGEWGAALRLRSLLVGPRAIGVRLGYTQGGVRGPWVLRTAFARLQGGIAQANWSDIASIEPGLIRLRGGTDPLPDVTVTDRPAGRVMDVGLELLDRQILDPDGRMAGNVDDLELRFPEGIDGSGPPSISALLAGPGALARRLGSTLGRWVAASHERLQDRHLEGPARIPFGVVTEVGQAVRVGVPFDRLPTAAFEGWVRTRIIDRIPGS
jgi:sporulation protein YlmC with PRC-barrel domain